MSRWILLLILAATSTAGRAADAEAPPRDALPATRVSVPPTPALTTPTVVAARSMVEYVGFPSAGIELVRPKGFDDAERFDGFQQPDTGSSVMVMAIPGPFSEVSAGFTKQKAKRQGMTIKSRKRVQIGEKPGILLDIEQTAHETRFAKWELIFGNEERTVMVMAWFPQSHAAELSEPLKAAVLSAREYDGEPVDPFTAVGFTLAPSEKLKLTPGVSRGLLYTKDGALPAKSPGSPLFVAATSFSREVIQDKREFALERVRQLAGTWFGAVQSNEPITIDGLEGYETIADGKDADSGTPLAIYQVVLCDEEGYISMGGLVDRRHSEEYLPVFKAMARSLKRIPGERASEP